MYKVYTRTWWKENAKWPDGLEPAVGRKTTIRANLHTEEEAHEICRKWNESHKPGKLSRKAEYEEQ